MVTINTIVSAAQNAVFDLEGSRVHEGEWVDMLNSALVEVGKRTQGYVRRETLTPVTVQGPTPVYEVELDPNNSPYVITRVVKLSGDEITECEEISTQAIMRTQQSDYSFEVNRTYMYNNSFSTKLVNSADVMDNTLTLVFARPFEVNEQVIVDYIGLKPVVYQLWNFNLTPPVGVPDYFEGALKYKLFHLVFELLFNRGDQFYYSRMQNANAEYEKQILELAAYTRLLRNREDVMRIRPVNWLPEV